MPTLLLRHMHPPNDAHLPDPHAVLCVQQKRAPCVQELCPSSAGCPGYQKPRSPLRLRSHLVQAELLCSRRGTDPFLPLQQLCSSV